MCKLTYEAKVLEEIETKPGYWKYSRIGIIKDDALIGEYIRNYHSTLGSIERTFYPFKLDGKEYALYSKEYMYTRIMSLPDCKDICGEDNSNTEYKNHFCPVEYYVPIVYAQSYPPKTYPYNPRHDPKTWASIKIENNVKHYDWKEADNNPLFKEACKQSDKEFKEWRNNYPHKYQYTPFGFVAGCPWGLDSSWQIRYIDLSNIENNEIKIDSRFGWIELPGGIALKQAIDCEGIDNLLDLDDSYINIAVSTAFRLNGKKCED